MIFHDEHKGTVSLETTASSYVIGLIEKQPVCLYWGAKLHREDLQEYQRMGHHSSFDRNILLERAEYPVADGRTFHGTCLQADRPVLFELEHVETAEHQLVLRLRDALNGHALELLYTVLYEHDAIVKTATIICGQQPLTLRRLLSGSVSMPIGRQGYRAHYLTGAWANEFQPRSIDVSEGSFRIESTRGLSGPHFNPSFVLEDSDSNSHGALLEWSGSWQMTVEKTIFGNLALRGGWNDQDFVALLQPGERLTAPNLHLCFAAGGPGALSRKLHHYQLTQLAQHSRPRRVLYNSWEATYFDVHVDKQMALATRAAQMGVELYVVDDGWFGQRKDDHAGLGDWEVNREKFPQGLKQLIDHVKAQGMDYGLWVEPESVNPDSDLYRQHPDWVYRLEGLEPLQLRNQYLLNLGLPEVEAFATRMLLDLLKHNEISYLKWDMNRPFTDVAEAITPLAREKHVLAVYRMLERLREEHPQVDIEACSGGGARVDLGMVRRTGQFWPSDNTDPYDRLSIQDGCARLYPARLTSCWVTESGHGTYGDWEQDLRYRFHSAMSGGTLGIGANITTYSEQQFELSRQLIAQYKSIRHLVHEGLRYSWGDPRNGEYHYVQYVNREQSEFVLFVFRGPQRARGMGTLLRLQGLSADTRYCNADTGEAQHGDSLMRNGLPVLLNKPFSSVCLHFVAEPAAKGKR